MSPSDLETFETLSRREAEVLAGIGDGKTNKEIAAELGISKRTVETHRDHVYLKLGATSAAALVKWAIKLGLTGSEP